MDIGSYTTPDPSSLAGRKKGTPNKLTAQLQAPLAQAARRYDGNALQTLVAIMNDDRATAAARVRCAEPPKKTCSSFVLFVLRVNGDRKLPEFQRVRLQEFR